jgi:hypothetical protein
MGILENFRNRSRFSDPVPDDTVKTHGRLKGAFLTHARNFSKRLQELGKRGISRRMDATLPENVFRNDKIDNMSTATVPKTREEDYASSIFEWVKADREGDVCKFKEFTVVNGEEYVVFNDNSRIKTILLGDVVLKHQHESQLLGKELKPAPKPEVTEDEPFEFPIVSDLTDAAKHAPKKLNFVADSGIGSYAPPQPTQPKADSPIASILGKSKKKKQKVTLEIQMELPSAEVLSIIRENFEGSDEELYDFFVEKIDRKKFVSAIISAIQNK